MLVNREVILAKIESTYNTDAVPTNSDAILCESISMTTTKVRMVERKAIRESLGPLKSLYGGHLVELTLEVELKGSGTEGTPAEISPLLQAAGFTETIVANTSVTHAPISSGVPSLTFYYYQDGLRTIVTGARCSGLSGTINAGEIGKLTFKFIGHVNSPSDTAMITPTYDSTVPSVILGLSFTVGGYAVKINSFTFDMGLKIATPTSISESDGYGEIRLADRKVVGTIDPEAELVATEPYVADWMNGVSAALTTSAIGGTAGNIVTLSMPAINYTNVVDGDRDGIRTYNIDFEAIESSGDDELSILFT